MCPDPVHFGDTLRRPSSPSENDYTFSLLSDFSTAAETIDQVDELVGERFPAFARVRPRLMRLDRERGVEEENSGSSEGSQ